MLFNILQCIGEPPLQRIIYLNNVNSANVESPVLFRILELSLPFSHQGPEHLTHSECSPACFISLQCGSQSDLYKQIRSCNFLSLLKVFNGFSTLSCFVAISYRSQLSWIWCFLLHTNYILLHIFVSINTRYYANIIYKIYINHLMGSTFYLWAARLGDYVWLSNTKIVMHMHLWPGTWGSVSWVDTQKWNC